MEFNCSKVKVKVKVTLAQATKAETGSKSVALLDFCLTVHHQLGKVI